MSAIDNVRARALASAMELLARDGPGGLTLRGIARHAGIGAASIYHHFDGREALLVAVALAGFTAMRREITDARDSGDPPDPVESGSLAFFDFARARPALFSLMFDTQLLLRHAEMRAAEQGILALFHELVAATPRIPEPHKTEVALALWAFGRGIAAMHASHPDGTVPEDELERIFDGASYLIDRGEYRRRRPARR